MPELTDEIARGLSNEPSSNVRTEERHNNTLLLIEVSSLQQTKGADVVWV